MAGNNIAGDGAGALAKEREVAAQDHQDEYLSVKAREDRGQH